MASTSGNKKKVMVNVYKRVKPPKRAVDVYKKPKQMVDVYYKEKHFINPKNVA